MAPNPTDYGFKKQARDSAMVVGTSSAQLLSALSEVFTFPHAVLVAAGGRRSL